MIWATMLDQRARVVSRPSCELFGRQTQEYQDGVLAPLVRARVPVEQASAPLMEPQKKFGFTPDAVVASAQEELAKAQ